MIPPAPHPRTTSCTGNRWRPQPILRHHPGDKASPNRRAGVRIGENFVDHLSTVAAPSRLSALRQVAMGPTVMIRSHVEDRGTGAKVSPHDRDHRLRNG